MALTLMIAPPYARGRAARSLNSVALCACRGSVCARTNARAFVNAPATKLMVRRLYTCTDGVNTLSIDFS